MAAIGQTTPAPERSAWTPARIFLLISTLYHVPLGVAGLIAERTFPVGAAATARAGSDFVFGVFETNGWHSVAALLVAAVSLYFTLRPARAREAALSLGVFHVGLVVALMVRPPETFWLASNAADQVIHAFTAVGGIVSARMTPGRVSTG